VACIVGPSVTTFSTDFSFQNLVFKKKLFWIFNDKNHLKINLSHILNRNFTKYIPLNLTRQDLSNNTKGTFHFLRNFQLRFNLIFSEEIIQYSRTFAPQVQMSWKPSPCTPPPRPELSFQRHKEHDPNQPSSVDLITTIQNKLSSFIDR
jgi:hypothetical protein